MIDYVKIKVVDPDIESIRKLPFLEWDQIASEETGEVKEYRSEYSGLTILIRGYKYLYIKGSLHHYWNLRTKEVRHNCDDFPFCAVNWVVKDIGTIFQFNLHNCKIENIEFGVNLHLPFPTHEVLKSVINHKGKPFDQEYNMKKYFRECRHTRYFVKLYDKGLQFRLSSNILRIENKTVKMEHLRKIDIKTLADLLNKGKVSALGSILLTDVQNLLMYDWTIQDDELNDYESQLLMKGQIPNYWRTLKNKKSENYYKKRNQFRGLVKKYGKNDLQGTIERLLTQKWADLLISPSESLQELTHM